MNFKAFGVGFGAGVQELRLLAVFKSRESYGKFLKGGWEFGGGADASLKRRGTEGGGETGIQVAEDLDPAFYQVTESGVNLSATVEGTKFSLNEELN